MEGVNAQNATASPGFLYGFLTLFYLVPPHHTYYRDIEDVPHYGEEAAPYFYILILIEAAILWFRHRKRVRLNDAITSISGALMMALTEDVLLRGFEVYIYIWVHDNYSFVQLPWDSPITWWVCFLCYDCLYYWFHRMAHEVNIFWASHQMHHSSEEYNLTTALRQSAFQKFCAWFFYIPLAFAIPPTHYLVHKQLNLLYQFWIHTEVVDRLGPLEYILNTPSHHRVHHGRNRYCIDKNYAGVLIIWDVIFGTFAPEKRDDKIYYGLVHPVNTFNPIKLQLFHFVHVIKSAWRADNVSTAISILVKGPGWYPGTPRLGDSGDIPEVPVVTEPYNIATPLWIHFYCVFQFIMANFMTLLLDAKKQEMPYLTSLFVVFFLFHCLTNIGLIYDHRSIAPVMEVSRLVLLLFADYFFRPLLFNQVAPPIVFSFVQVTHLFSFFLWSWICYKQTNKPEINKN